MKACAKIFHPLCVVSIAGAIMLAAVLAMPATAQTPTTGSGQAFPSKSVRIIAPFPPASVADVLARPMAQKMSETWGQPVIVDNRTGAGGNVGAELVAKSAPAGTPRDVVARLHSESARILALPEIKAHYATLGMAAVSSTPEQFSAYIHEETTRWAKIVKASGARAD